MHQLPLALALYLFPLVSSYTWPSPQYDALEGLLYEGRRSDGSSLASLVHPCRKRTGTLASVPAEWLRFAFHDMATHNVDDGSGGLDGSIVYELQRPENFGLGFEQTLDDFIAFPNKLVSRADVITIGAIMAVSTCGGPQIPFRGGRTDVWTPGGTGTPEPQHELNVLTESFRKQGFNQAEMIKLVACGHTMGGVRSADFPQLVPPNPDSPDPVIVDFDTTMDFDNDVVTEYLDGTTQNVLVNSPNKTMVSDLRVFEADGNNTMKALADKNTFQSECKTMLARMVDTVPKSVNLTDEITLLPAKVTAAQLSFEKNQLVFKASFRLLQTINTKANANRVVTMFWCDRYGKNKDCSGKTSSSIPVRKTQDDPNVSPITLNLGSFFLNYNFVVPIDGAASLSKFWFEVDEGDGSKPTVYQNGDIPTGSSSSSAGNGSSGGKGNGYLLDQDQVLFVPTLSHVDIISNGNVTKTYTNRVGETFTRSYTLTVAIKDGVSPSRVYVDASDVTTPEFATALSASTDLSLSTDPKLAPVGGYSFYTGQVKSEGLQLMIDAHAVAGEQTYTQSNVQTLVLDGTVLVAPGNVTTGKSSVATSAALGSASLSSSWFALLGALMMLCWL